MLSYEETIDYAKKPRGIDDLYALPSRPITFKDQQVQQLYVEIALLEQQLKVLKENLQEICTHQYFTGQTAFISDDELKLCNICGYKEWKS